MVGEESGLVGSIICWEMNAAVIVAAAIATVFATTVSAVTIVLAMRLMAMVDKIIVLIQMLQVGRGRMWY